MRFVSPTYKQLSESVASHDMKQTISVIATVAICSALFVILMWAPFTYSLTAGQIVKYALIGAALGLVFYFVAIKKAVTRRKPIKNPLPQQQVSKKAKRTKVTS
jgi:hypothetical protein